MKIQAVFSALLGLTLLVACIPTPATVPVSVLARTAQRRVSESPRFSRALTGVITDRQTGLQWLEGPDLPTSWEMANAWVNTLGEGWRLPTTAELEAIYLKDSPRYGLYHDPLGLDPAFIRDSGYSLWSVRRNAESAWMYDFSRGYAHWTEINVKGHFDRAVAVRIKSAQLELPLTP